MQTHLDLVSKDNLKHCSVNDLHTFKLRSSLTKNTPFGHELDIGNYYTHTHTQIVVDPNFYYYFYGISNKFKSLNIISERKFLQSYFAWYNSSCVTHSLNQFVLTFSEFFSVEINILLAKYLSTFIHTCEMLVKTALILVQTICNALTLFTFITWSHQKTMCKKSH